MPRKPFMAAYKELLESKIMETDERYRIVWMPCALRLVGPPVSPNVVKGYCRSLNQLPPSPLLQAAKPLYWEALKGYGRSFSDPFAKAFGSLLEGLIDTDGKSSENPDPEELNRYKNKNRYPYNDSNSPPDHSGDRIKDITVYLQQYGGKRCWPEASLQKIPSLAAANLGVILDDLRASEPILQRNRKAKDPASCLFGIARNRNFEELGRQDAVTPSS